MLAFIGGIASTTVFYRGGFLEEKNSWTLSECGAIRQRWVTSVVVDRQGPAPLHLVASDVHYSRASDAQVESRGIPMMSGL
ncbi:hypothetical protein [Mesorhizobium sp. Cs1321R2N1]|uniref:hypothetical protein n=1 Tax=Mesorhizobium sp. Cs1321R2N1 TaxID=3015174 RepID=UPI00301C338F